MENIINFISNIDNSTYNKIRHSKSDAECRRYLKEQLTKQLNLTDVMKWVAVEDRLPPILETIWLSNGKGWTDLGCRVEANKGWHWAGQNGIIYQEKDQIVAECESDDLDVVYWCKLPKPPCA